MTRLVLRRLLTVVPMLLGVVLFTFVLIRLSGQDPVMKLAGPTATTQEIALVRQGLGLDQPIPTQLYYYLRKLVVGDFGRSWLSNRPVLSDVLERIPVTLELLLWGVTLGALIGVTVGLRAARLPDGTFDQVSRFLSLFGFSVPTYWLGLVMLFVFFYLLNWAPPGMGRISLIATPPPRITGSYLIDGLIARDAEVAWSAAAQLVLPVLCIAIISAAPILKQTRAVAVEVSGSDYIRYARAQGLSEREVSRMVLRNARVPILTFLGTELTGLVGTTSLIEYVFAWGGLGQYGLNAIISGDFAAIQGYVFFLALFSVLVFLIIDLIVLVIEPRARGTA
ncbi:MAG: ABC transporter permease [Gammaproteobacteria bacterium]|nr:ABC transporter permease [Gammaproteobacteria bacterium]